MRLRLSLLATIGIVALFGLSFSGCGDDDSSPTNPGGNSAYFPLAIGNYWIYDVRDYTNNVLDSAYVDTMRIDTSFVYLGKTWFGEKGDDTYFRTGSEGAFELIDMVDELVEIRVYKPTAHNGEKWDTQGGGYPLSVETLGVNDTLNTSAGSFTGAHHYLMGDRIPFSEDYHFKAGVGILERVSWLRLGGTSSRSEMTLKAYHLN